MRWLARLRAGADDPASFRSWTLIANDGIIATAGILEGFAGAGASGRTLVLAATTATAVGMLSTGGAEWAEAAAERDGQLATAAAEAAELQLHPDEELQELVDHFIERGVEPDLAREVSVQLTAFDALDAQLENEHGITEIMSIGATIAIGIGAGIAYLLGALVPLLISWLVPYHLSTELVVLAALSSLTATSILGARNGQMNLRRTIARTLVVGLGTMAISYLVGTIVV